MCHTIHVRSDEMCHTPEPFLCTTWLLITKLMFILLCFVVFFSFLQISLYHDSEVGDRILHDCDISTFEDACHFLRLKNYFWYWWVARRNVYLMKEENLKINFASFCWIRNYFSVVYFIIYWTIEVTILLFQQHVHFYQYHFSSVFKMDCEYTDYHCSCSSDLPSIDSLKYFDFNFSPILTDHSINMESSVINISSIGLYLISQLFGL